MAEIDAYNEALRSGQYEKPSGLLGKYDNVRRFWEDEQLGLYLRPHLERMVDRVRQRGEKIRVLDLGCGGGDGFELITCINSSEIPISKHKAKIIDPEILGIYKGVDVNAELLGQARSIYANRESMVFVQSDINSFDYGSEEPYDLYLANYGTLSHNGDDQTVELLSSLAKHGKDGAVIIIDWLGRYSYEWQTLWTQEPENNQWMDYVISYIHKNSAEKHQELSSFALRIMGREEVLSIYERVKANVGDSLHLRELADRSSLVGRHMDTLQYNPHSRPLRGVVNSLFEPSVNTDLDDALIHYVPKEGFDDVNAYYQDLSDCWNYLVTCTKALLEESTLPPPPAKAPEALDKSVNAMKTVVKAASGMEIGSPRACLVEPQLAYCLRELEMGIQKGQGCGHGFVAIFEITK